MLPLAHLLRRVQELGGVTGEIMKELLEFEADARAIRITINSFNNPQLNDPAAGREGERQPLYCTFGKLYPEVSRWFTFRFSSIFLLSCCSPSVTL